MPPVRLPPAALGAATDAHDQLGRAMVVVTAAAVRDILTGHEPDAPFDAAGVELVEAERGPLYPTGRYWTLTGEERTFTEAVGESEAGNGIHDMSEWTAYLDDSRATSGTRCAPSWQTATGGPRPPRSAAGGCPPARTRQPGPRG